MSSRFSRSNSGNKTLLDHFKGRFKLRAVLIQMLNQCVRSAAEVADLPCYGAVGRRSRKPGGVEIAFNNRDARKFCGDLAGQFFIQGSGKQNTAEYPAVFCVDIDYRAKFRGVHHFAAFAGLGTGFTPFATEFEAGFGTIGTMLAFDVMLGIGAWVMFGLAAFAASFSMASRPLPGDL